MWCEWSGATLDSLLQLHLLMMGSAVLIIYMGQFCRWSIARNSYSSYFYSELSKTEYLSHANVVLFMFKKVSDLMTMSIPTSGVNKIKYRSDDLRKLIMHCQCQCSSFGLKARLGSDRILTSKIRRDWKYSNI